MKKDIKEEFKDKVQVCNYLISKFGDGVEIIKVIKLLFLADVYALRNYGTTITKDNYMAMENGPVASCIDDIVEKSNQYLGESELKYVNDFIERKDNKNVYDIVFSRKSPDEYHLSELDKEAIDKIFEEYSKCTPEELINITHKFSAWKKHETELEGGKKSVKMDLIDIYENDGELSVDEETSNSAKNLYFSRYV